MSTHNSAAFLLKGWRLEKAKRYKEALIMYNFAASIGNAEAWLLIGRAFDRGRGLVKNFQMEKFCYEMASRLGNAVAKVNLAVMYLKGQGVRKNVKQAKRYYREASRLGDSDADFNLGLLAETEGKKRLAKLHYLKAVRKRNWKAANSLGVMILDSRNRKLCHQGIFYIKLAARHGNSNAIRNLKLEKILCIGRK